jgi:GMP synthase (glutamine-hydrolysing)
MKIEEIKVEDLNPEKFIAEKIAEIKETVGDNQAIVALSGGVDSSVTTALANLALDNNLRVIMVDNGIMREGEVQSVVKTFNDLGITVEVIDAKEEFFEALKGLTDPEEKREAITQTFYKKIFSQLVKASGIRFIFHGTILTDVEETVAGIKRQHNIFMQIGIDPEKEFGYRLLEPLVQLRKDGVRKVGQALGLPKSIWNRMPFPGPALAARVIGEVTHRKIAIVRKATAIVEEELEGTDAFQFMAILHKDKVTGMKDGKRAFGLQIEVRCWESIDTRIATPTELPWPTLKRLAERITTEMPSVVSVVYNITSKPPSTMEVV